MDDPRLLIISPDDNVATATTALEAGEELSLGAQLLRISSTVPVGHKVALQVIPAGSKVIKYGLSIGSATQPINSGDHVHSHNLKSDYMPATGRGRVRTEG